MIRPSDAPAPSGPEAPPEVPGVSAETPPAPRPACDAAGRARQRRLGRLGDEIARLSAHIQAATYRMLEMLRAFDAEKGWHEEGFRSCAAWLSWRTGLAPGAAREKVRVARALADLPVLGEALAAGELSYSAARALTRVARPENEAELVEVARHTTAADLERLVRAWRAADRGADLSVERERHRGRELWLVPKVEGGWRIRGDLDPEVGALLQRALDAAGEVLYEKAGAEADHPAEARRSDALGLVAEAALGEGLGPRPATSAGAGERDPELEAEDAPSATDRAPVVGRAERFQVVAHVSAETLAAGAGAPGAPGGPARLAGGPHIPAETARRLACDAGLVTMVHGRRGEVLDIGRRTRTVPPALRRALEHRDRGCRFPGCSSRFCDAHHIVPWAEGGETSLDNLLLLCRHHHRRVHEDGWRVELADGGDADAPTEVRVHRPDGRPLPRLAPPPALPEDPVRALEEEQRSLGIDADTATPRWTGEPLDVDWTLFTLWEPPPGLDVPWAPPRRRGPGPDVSAGTSPAMQHERGEERARTEEGRRLRSPAIR